jgi:hypothetical protein
MKINIYNPETLEKKVFANGVQIIPAEGAITIYDPLGVEILSDECVVADDGTLSYVIDYDTIQDWELGRNYRILWEYWLDDDDDEEIAKRINDLFDLVGFTFDASEITSDDLFRYSPYLEEVKEVIAGTCTTTGLTKDIINDSAIKETSSFKFKGSMVIFRTGANEGTIRNIIDFGSGVITLDEALPSVVTLGDRYFVKKGYQVEIETALDSVELDLYQKGLEMENIVDIEQIKPLVLIRASMDICFARISTPQDVWTYRYEGLKVKYNEQFEGLKLKLSSEGDGVMDETSSLGQPKAVR